ncbi:MAG: hypothetical protein KME30_27685 [Iphinoe sp. HA4291-MV1]|nr:hypothetical protein [Iphinoe sp. HA4291-MV1]
MDIAFSGTVISYEWAMGNGQWAMGNGQWAMGNGQWAMLDNCCLFTVPCSLI